MILNIIEVVALAMIAIGVLLQLRTIRIWRRLFMNLSDRVTELEDKSVR